MGAQLLTSMSTPQKQSDGSKVFKSVDNFTESVGDVGSLIFDSDKKPEDT